MIVWEMRRARDPDGMRLAGCYFFSRLSIAVRQSDPEEMHLKRKAILPPLLLFFPRRSAVVAIEILRRCLFRYLKRTAILVRQKKL